MVKLDNLIRFKNAVELIIAHSAEAHVNRMFLSFDHFLDLCSGSGIGCILVIEINDPIDEFARPL